jgi:hypothetical protein
MKSILVGNGLNRCIETNNSWGDLLESLANRLNVKKSFEEYNLPFEYEVIVNEYMKQNKKITDPYMETKEQICSFIQGFDKPSEIGLFDELFKVNFDNLMTTNYDYMLEKFLNSKFKGIAPHKNTKYLLNKTGNEQEINFYHIHGDVNFPRTICLGYEHYIGLTAKLRDEINKNEKKKSKEMKIINKLYELTEFENTWEEKFYTDDISIIGLGLDDSEVDLWWILTHRASVYYRNPNDVRSKLKNRIVFYDVIDPNANESEKNKKKNRHKRLKSMHVEVVVKELIREETYKDKYFEMINEIKGNYGSRKKDIVRH